MAEAPPHGRPNPATVPCIIKFVLLAARGPDVHSRILLDIAFADSKGGEAATAVRCLERTAPLVPGAMAVVYDTALRGIHHQTILRDLGLIPINRVAAPQAGSKTARRSKKDQRVEKLVFVEQKTIQQADDITTTVDLYARGGAIGIGTLAVDGELLFTPLPRVRTRRNADKNGYRWYNDYRLPEKLGGGVVTIRLYADAKDAIRMSWCRAWPNSSPNPR